MQSKLRILQVNSVLTGGGTDEACVRLSQALSGLNQNVFVAGPDSQFADRLRQSGVTILPLPRQKPIPVALGLARHICAVKPDIIHAHHGRDYWPTVIGAALSRQRPKIVLTRHLAKSPGSPMSKYFLLSRCDAMIGVSEFVARVLSEGAYEPQSPEAERRVRPPMRGDHNKIVAIAGGIDTTTFRPADASEIRKQFGLGPEHFAFAVIGSYDLPRGKGQREFLRAAAMIHEKVPHARFLIIGRGSMESTLKADIQQLGLTDKASLIGQRRDIAQVMNAIDCLVHPQIGTEAFGLVICEAHACGKPVIASALDGIPEAFAATDYGQLVTQENVAELANAMSVWANKPAASPQERLRLHSCVAEKFSLPVLADRTLKVYQRLTGEVGE
jgi:glycosyltransferase involved in cell wall biosynthesis